MVFKGASLKKYKRKSKDFRWCLKGASLKKYKRKSKDFRWC